MKNKYNKHISNLILPCLVFSVATGFFAALITITFKILAELIIHISASVYDAVRANPILLPLLILGAAAIGLAESIILSKSHSCRGGGIPTSVAAICGIFSFKWVKTILLLPVSALLTFLSGLPLGTEGPCVQMGTAVGDGVVKCFGGEKNRGWRRYIMTGGASAGFSIATSSPISAIIFSMEEIHKHFSPLLLSVVSVSVVTAQLTARVFAALGIGATGLFGLPEIEAIPLRLFFAPVAIGIVAGAASILFTRLFRLVDRTMRIALKRLSSKVVLPVLFALVAIVGFFFADALGTGHSLVDTLLNGRYAWYLLILLFLIRAIGTIVSNTSGATGGIFLPTLAFGAILGSLMAEVMIALGLIGTEHYTVMVVLGITAFLGATSRIPLTAAVFAIEALSGINNIIPLIIATTASMLIVESARIEDLTDAVINAKAHRITKGKVSVDVEAALTVRSDAFVVGKELRDVLWPNSCVVLSFEHKDHSKAHSIISEGDVITVHYATYDLDATLEELNALVGEQTRDIIKILSEAH